MKLFFLVLIFLFVSFLSGYAKADEETGNRVYVTTSKYGLLYAKSIPDERYGLKGITKVYKVRKQKDSLIQTYNWYSPQVFLAGHGGAQSIYIVQLGPWHRGRKATPDHQSIAFYKGGELLRSYSTLEIAGEKQNVSASKSHYKVFSKLLGFRRPFGNQLVFDTETSEGRRLSFDADTGDRLTKEEEDIKKLLYGAKVKIAKMKRKWYEKNKEALPTLETMELTEKILKEFSPDDFPTLPSGYYLVPNTVWKPIQFEKVDAE